MLEVRVQSIENIDGENHYRVRVSVRSQAEAGFFNDADFSVCVPKRDAPISEIRQEALQAVYDLIQDILEARLVVSSRHN